MHGSFFKCVFFPLPVCNEVPSYDAHKHTKMYCAAYRCAGRDMIHNQLMKRDIEIKMVNYFQFMTSLVSVSAVFLYLAY